MRNMWKYSSPVGDFYIYYTSKNFFLKIHDTILRVDQNPNLLAEKVRDFSTVHNSFDFLRLAPLPLFPPPSLAKWSWGNFTLK